MLAALNHDCDVLTALGDSDELELEPLASSELDEPALDSLLSLASVLPFDSVPALDSSPLVPASLDSSLDSPAPELVEPLLLASPLLASPADSVVLVLVDLPLLPLVLDALCAAEVERAFDEADSAGSCPDASCT